MIRCDCEKGEIECKGTLRDLVAELITIMSTFERNGYLNDVSLSDEKETKALEAIKVACDLAFDIFEVWEWKNLYNMVQRF